MLIERKGHLDFLIEWKEQQIISISFEDVDNEPLCDYKALYEHGGKLSGRHYGQPADVPGGAV